MSTRGLGTITSASGAKPVKFRPDGSDTDLTASYSVFPASNFSPGVRVLWEVVGNETAGNQIYIIPYSDLR